MTEADAKLLESLRILRDHGYGERIRGLAGDAADAIERLAGHIEEMGKDASEGMAMIESQRGAIERLSTELAEARNEALEQARVNGMGGEREARLLARVAELEAALEDLRDTAS